MIANGGIGQYELARTSRTVTSSRLSFDGSRNRQIGPGRFTNIRVRVSPSGSGPVIVTIQRLDPVDGFQFLKRVKTEARNGVATVPFLPPSVGRYRASASFDGSRDFAPSRTRTARLLVAAPLRD